MKLMNLLLVAIIFAAATNSFSQGSIDISFRGTAERYPADNPVEVIATMQNNSKDTVRIINYLTPVNGVMEDFLTLTFNGRQMDYIGPHVRRFAPRREDYVILNPGESVSGLLTLWDNYDISQSGTYTLSFKTEVFEKRPILGGEWGPPYVATAEIDLNIEGREPPPDWVEDDFPVESLARQDAFRSCSDSEKATLRTARDNATLLSSASNSYFMAGTVSAPYTDWFGVFNAGRYAGLAADFARLDNAMGTEKFIYKCRENNCGDGAIAWVRPRREFRIHICPAFFDLPATGQLSHADTLIHEVSHFNDIAGTDDHEYGVADCLALAISNPNNAANNADNFAFFSVDALAVPPSNCPGSQVCGQYQAHVAGLGWMGYVGELATAGTTGQSRQMEAAQINITNAPAGVGIQYRAHVAGNGWLGWVGNNQVAGTTGQGRRMEAIQIQLTNAPAGCNIAYRAHVAGIGWQGWVSNGATAGTTGQSRQMEALQIDFQCP